MKQIELNSLSHSYRSAHGFTLIELVAVIILISIMATTVLPKFLTSNGFEEYTYRDELIIKLRAIQLRSMQQTNDSTCRLIQFTPATIGLLATTKNATTCETDYAGNSTKVAIDDYHINFIISESLASFSFSSLGRPVGCASTTLCEITITVDGESAPRVFINSEGYIHAI